MALIAFDARDAFAPMPHGSGIYVRQLLAALRGLLGEEHELWALEQGGSGPELWWEQVTLPRLLRRRAARLVHAPDSFLPLRRPCPGVLTIHDLAFEAVPREMARTTAWKYRTFVARGARSAELVICPSQFTADDVCARYGVPPERIRVIPEAGALAPGSEDPPPGPYLVAVGDLRPKKNLEALVDAYRLLRREGLEHRLLLVGADFGIGAALHSLAGGEPLELLGFVSDGTLDALLRGADALVVPSVYEGFGLVVLDAMARGCPTILANAGALPETGGDAALYFDPWSLDELGSTITHVVSDTAVRARLSAVGRAHAAAFTWERTANLTRAVYEELL